MAGEAGPLDLPAVSRLDDVLRWRAARQPEQTAYIFLRDGETESARITYAELDRWAVAIAARLGERGAAGERVLLLFHPGLDYIAGFLACLYAGAIAVPAYPPHPNPHRPLPRLRGIAADARPRFVLTSLALLAKASDLSARIPELAGAHWLAPEEIAEPSGPGPRPSPFRPPGEASPLAMLQYTSGSTAQPRGVELSHGNLLHNLGMIHHRFEHGPESVGVIWLPPYHDMGLIGGILQPLYGGFPVVLMPPAAFAQSPLRWLAAISRYRATGSGGPNFAYDLCVQKISEERRRELDLSCWKVAFNGAEPIHDATIERFTAAFAECGFRREAFLPCYGQAEATLLVAGGPAGVPPTRCHVQAQDLARHRVVETAPGSDGSRTLVASGRPGPGVRAVIVDPETATPEAPGRIGEIWLASPSVGQGYWGRPGSIAETFRVHLADGEGPFLRTGDLGFLRDGELFVTGRKKDLIVIRGRNHYPQDIERTVEQSHSALRRGATAAFALEVDGEERLAVAQEIRRDARRADPAEILAAIRRNLAAVHELQAHAVLLLRPGSLPLTSSGKIMRHACRAALEDGSFSRLAMFAEEDPAKPASVLDGAIALVQAGARFGPPAAAGDLAAFAGIREIVAQLAEPAAGDSWESEAAALRAAAPEAREDLLMAALWRLIRRAAHLPPSPPEGEAAIAELGLDSLAAVEIGHRIERGLGIALSPSDLLDGTTLRELSRGLLARWPVETPPASPVSAVERPVALPAESAENAENAESPLSQGQKALWFSHLLAPGAAVGNLARAFHLSPEVDLGRLAAAFERLAARHPALRTTFGARQGEPFQRIHPHLPPVLAERDATDWDDSRLAAYLAERARTPFDLERGPLLYLEVLHRAGDRRLLLLVIHHLITDFWSLAMMALEVGEAYAATGEDAPPTEPPAPPPYTAFVAWQAAHLRAAEGERLWAYWREALAGPLVPARLPTDRPRPELPTFAGRRLGFRFPPQLGAALQGWARAEQTSLYTVLLAGLAAVLARYSGSPGGEEDVLIASPLAGRSRPELASTFGYFVNPAVLRLRPTAAAGFTEFLAAARRTALGALAHQDFPLPLLVERLRPERSAGSPPLFGVLFVLQQGQPADERFAALALGVPAPPLPLTAPGGGETGLTIEPHPILEQPAELDLTLMMAAGGDHLPGLLGVLEYRTDLFDAATPARLASHLETLLAAAVAHPEAPLGSLPILAGGERHQLLAEWNDTAVAAVPAATIAELFAAQAARTPGAPALSFAGESLTYRELLRRVNGLAGTLRARGVGPEVRVGVALERSMELVVAVLAVLAAGGAYVPLDPTYPEERRELMAADAQVALILAQPGEVGVTSDAGQASDAGDAGDIGAPSFPRTDPQNLAYVIYTSGSTGRPKGAMNTHRALVNRLLWMQERFALGPEDRVLHKTPIGFDVSVWELLWPLLAGATLVVAPPEAHRDPAALARLLREERITTLHFVPSMLQVFLDEADLAGCPPCRVIASGEALTSDLARRFHERWGGELYNLYGPTEAAIDVSVWPAATATPGRPGRQGVPIGRPIHNIQLRVLDPLGELAPTGVAGELYIGDMGGMGGMGLARGYLGRPDHTAASFLPDPFGEPGSRLYRTGDLARLLPGGAIEFLGRTDHQVKVRGVRVEPAEVEAALYDHPAVREAVVRARPGPGGARLLAWVVPASPAPLPSLGAELRAFLERRLPAAMVPASIVPLAALPLLPNGKIDTASLPAPAPRETAPGSPLLRPLAGVEGAIAAAWTAVLPGVGPIVPSDNFFELGGHSLLLPRIASRLGEQLGREIPVLELLRYPTLSSLAAWLARGSLPTALDTRDEAFEARFDAGRDRLRRRLAQRQGAAPGEA